MIGELVIDCLRRSVVQCVFEDGAGNAGVLVVERNEGFHAISETSSGNGLIGEADLREWEFSAEVALFEAREAFEPLRRKPCPCRPWSKILNGGNGPSTNFVTGAAPLMCRMANAASGEFEVNPAGSAVVSGRVRMEKSCRPPEPLMQMHPAPRPPMGIATWVARSPLNVRCWPVGSSSLVGNGSDSLFSRRLAGSAGRASDAFAGTVAARAAVEPATRNSRRDGFFSDINNGGYGCGKVNTGG